MCDFSLTPSRGKRRGPQKGFGCIRTDSLSASGMLSFLVCVSLAFFVFFPFRHSYYLQPKSRLFKLYVLMSPQSEETRTLLGWVCLKFLVF